MQTGALVCGWPCQVHSQGCECLGGCVVTGVFEDCCLAYHYPLGWAVLRHAWAYRLQEVSGSCNLPAAIFYLPKRHRKVCGNPKNKEVQRAMKLLDARNKIFAKFRHNTQTFQ
uniref:C-C motif chemokine 25 n=2 Tax=Rhinopithecus bieti TaxID=61621 RepID=A0A2K6LSZ8_RHIBE